MISSAHLKAPDGFMLLCRTGYAVPFMHVESKRTGQVPGVIVKTSGVNQAELEYHCAKLLREIHA